MCGFIGAFNTDLSSTEIENAAETIAHRGPDGRQVVQHSLLHLVAYRLAIVPPSDAPPVQTLNGAILTLNGEIYGLQEVGRENATDSEALFTRLRMYDPFSVLQDLRGLFAFAYFDGERLLLVRDRFGIKPLYYAHHRGGLVFASEMKALLALPGVSREPDYDVLAAFQVVGYNVFPGRTPFQGVFALRPGHALSILAGESAIEDYRFAWSPPASEINEFAHEDAEHLAVKVEGLLDRAVEQAMTHDPYPKGLFFSGGLDSSLLLDLAHRHGSILAYVLTDRPDADDLIEARNVARAIGIPLHEQCITAAELSHELVHYAWHFEQPIAEGAFDLLGGAAFHALARTVSQDCKVALCGEGADELFLGYHRLHVEPGLALVGLIERADMHATPALREWMEERGLLAPYRDRVADVLRELALQEGLSEYHLVSVDRSGMAFGLEIRPPYLDEELAKYVSSLPEIALLDRVSSWTKMPLRAIARRRFEPLNLRRVAVRRKRAMPSAVEQCGQQLVSELAEAAPVPGTFRLGSLLEDLFWYLHVDPGFKSPPQLTLHEFARIRYSTEHAP